MTPLFLFLFLSFAVTATPPTGPDTLVVCPLEFRPALVEWEAHRRSQGHRLAFAEPIGSAETLRRGIRQLGKDGELKYVVLIGDAPSAADPPPARGPQSTIMTNYVAAKVNRRWGPEKEIATDTPYADIDGDDTPDIAVGRIPVRSAKELAAVLRKVIQYEQQTDDGPWRKCLNIVSGCGGFGAVADAVIEGAGRQVVEQTVPAGYDVRHICATSVKFDGTESGDFGSRARQELSGGGGLAWIYVGHGLPTQLAGVVAAGGKPRSILSTRDVPSLRCGPHNPLAVLIACYTGAMDAPQGCLGEELLRAEQGPVAVIAATRVSMPYGNTVMGYELLRACFQEQPATLGDVMQLAQRRALTSPADDQMRVMLDGIAQLVSPPPADLATERREHVLMYHLIGDPLLRLRRPAAEVAQGTAATIELR